MPRRSLLTPADRTGLLAFPTTDDDRVRHYTFSEPDLSVIRQRRGQSIFQFRYEPEGGKISGR